MRDVPGTVKRMSDRFMKENIYFMLWENTCSVFPNRNLWIIFSICHGRILVFCFEIEACGKRVGLLTVSIQGGCSCNLPEERPPRVAVGQSWLFLEAL